MTSVLGIHHISVIASDPQRNVDFYTGLMGLRLVKRTVNFDDPQTYHLYYGDETGTPGTILTFFPWPGAHSGRQGAGQAAVVSFSIPAAAMGFWIARLVHHGLRYEGPTRRTMSGVTEQVIAFRDHDGLMLELVAHPGAERRAGHHSSPAVPAEHSIRGFHSVTLWVGEHVATDRVFVDTLGLVRVGEGEGTRRYAAAADATACFVDVKEVGGFLGGVPGAGTVHHIAFQVADDAAELELRGRLEAARLGPTEVRDRLYFRSVYFREPGGILCELATLAPGFTVDEPVERLGGSLMLPPQYESMRGELEASLPRIHLPLSEQPSAFLESSGPEDVSAEALGFVHHYLPPTATGELAGGTTLLLLHGTGGSEDDLIPLARSLAPGAGILSPRGKVLEGGALRFFRRLAEGVLDQEDLALRTTELAEFVVAAAVGYQLDRRGIVAIGFSNGANIATSLLLRYPGVLRAAMLLSPMLPFEPEKLPDLRGTAVFIGAGRRDPLVPVAQVERLDSLLREAGAAVYLHLHSGGHSITNDELVAARDWLSRLGPAGDLA